MDRGAWRAIVYGVSESDMTEHACIQLTLVSLSFLLLSSLCSQRAAPVPITADLEPHSRLAHHL